MRARRDHDLTSPQSSSDRGKPPLHQRLTCCIANLDDASDPASSIRRSISRISEVVFIEVTDALISMLGALEAIAPRICLGIQRNRSRPVMFSARIGGVEVVLCMMPNAPA